MKAFISSLGEATLLLLKTFGRIFSGRFEKGIVLDETIKIGAASTFLAVLSGTFTGMVFALQVGESFRGIFNEPVYVGVAVGYSILMELGPVLTGLVVAGRAGAAQAAEIGTMKVTEQIDALYTLGSEPIGYIFAPRFLAFLISLPILTVFAMFSGIIGGLFVSKFRLFIPVSKFWEEIVGIPVDVFFHGFIKTFFFAIIIAWVSCYNGFTTSGGAEGVGKSTTRAVVISMILVLVADYFLSSFLISIGIP